LGPKFIEATSMCVLLVEDDALVREVMVISLQDAGFEVLSAASGDEAIALMSDPAVPLTVLVTDFHMPGTADGAAVAAKLRERWPELPVVIISGRPEVFQVAWRRDLGYRLLAKPFGTAELVGLLQSLVD
jgi:DNA-binding response OmpR family regulator